MARQFRRRIFVQHLAFMGGGVVLLGGCRRESPDTARSGRKSALVAHLTFTGEEYQVMASAVDRMLPKDQDPGALEANVPAYIDRMLQTPELSQMKDEFIAGTAALNRRARRMFGKAFFEATAEQRDDLLRIFRDSKPGSGEAHYFELLTVLTMEGFLGDPSYGGNQDQVGWRLVGFNTVGHDAMSPPPGHDGMRALHHH